MKKRSTRKKRAAVKYPAELTGTTAKRVWRETLPSLTKRLSLIEIDHRTLIQYCNAWQLLWDSQQSLKKADRYLLNPNGTMSIHPAVTDERNANRAIRQLATELGMSLKSRRGMKVKKSAEADPLQDFLGTKPK